MAAGEGAGGAGVVGADFAGGEGVEELFAGVVEGFELEDLAAEVAELGEPVAGVEGEELVDLFAETLGEGGGVAGGGDGDLEVAAADDGGEVEVAEGRVVDGVDQDAGGLGFGEDCAVDGGRCRWRRRRESFRRGRRGCRGADGGGSRRAAARSRIRGFAWGAMTVTWAPAARRDSIFDSARWPAPMTMQGRAVSLRKMGKRDMSSGSPRCGVTPSPY